jgi:hypothetical protein
MSPFASFQTKTSQANKESQIFEINKNWSTTINNDEVRYKVSSGSTYRSNVRKSQPGSQSRRHQLTHNLNSSNYYNNRILSTLLKSKKPAAAVTNTSLKIGTTPSQIFKAMHNMPIQTKTTKSFKKTYKSVEAKTDRKKSFQPRVVPQSNFSVSSTPYTQQ